MIQIPPADLPTGVSRALAGYQARVDREPDYARRVELAAARFKRYNRADNPVFREIRRMLDSMCAGARRCMYCEDSAADEVEHHHPKNLFPDLAFVWTNYLYACGPCNGPKNNRFAVLAKGKLREVTRRPGDPVKRPVAGRTALLHPRLESALDFMTLDIAGDTFLFVPTARHPRRAEYTLEILGLNNRDYLRRARREAYESYRARVREYISERDAGAGQAKLDLLVDALRRMQHPTVWHEMRRQRTLIPELARLFRQAPEALSW